MELQPGEVDDMLRTKEGWKAKNTCLCDTED